MLDSTAGRLNFQPVYVFTSSYVDVNIQLATNNATHTYTHYIRRTLHGGL